MTELRITQTRSSIGEKPGARETLKALGLRKTGARVTQTDTPTLRGMLRRIAHLVSVEDQAR
jgi:large subunit ribosomal protein L30